MNYKFEISFKEGKAIHVQCTYSFSHIIMCRFSAWDDVALKQYDGRSGIYILVGENGCESSSADYYIGQTTNLKQRLNDHRRKKHWIQTILFCTVDTPNFEHDIQAYLQYIESYVIAKAQRTDSLMNRIKIDGQTGNFKMKEEDHSIISNLIDQFIAMASALGYERFFTGSYLNDAMSIKDKLEPVIDGIQCYITNLNVSARGIMLSNGQFLVCKGSNIRPQGVADIDRQLRQQLCDNGIIKDRVFTTDYEFSSPSRAAKVILDYSANGLDVWKTRDGKSLKDYIK